MSRTGQAWQNKLWKCSWGNTVEETHVIHVCRYDININKYYSFKKVEGVHLAGPEDQSCWESQEQWQSQMRLHQKWELHPLPLSPEGCSFLVWVSESGIRDPDAREFPPETFLQEFSNSALSLRAFPFLYCAFAGADSQLSQRAAFPSVRLTSQSGQCCYWSSIC